MTRTPTASILDRAADALRAAVVGLDRDALARPTPCAQWSVAQVLDHALIDQGIWASVVAGAPMPSGDAFAPTGELPDDVTAAVEQVLAASARAWASVPSGRAVVPSPLPQGELPVDEARAAAALDAAVHAWDIAAATGADSPLDDELAAGLLPTAQRLVEPLRQWGAYAAALPASADAGPAATLLRYLGRDPGWTSA